jgi:hypothetical protein
LNNFVTKVLIFIVLLISISCFYVQSGNVQRRSFKNSILAATPAIACDNGNLPYCCENGSNSPYCCANGSMAKNCAVGKVEGTLSNNSTNSESSQSLLNLFLKVVRNLLTAFLEVSH